MLIAIVRTLPGGEVKDQPKKSPLNENCTTAHIYSVYTDIAVRSLTCHTATGTHMPHGIAQCYLPPGSADISAFTPAEAEGGYRLAAPGAIHCFRPVLQS